MSEQSPKAAVFYVLRADDASAVLQDVATGQVHALAGDPELTEGTVVEATVEPVPPTGAAWELVELNGVRDIEVRAAEGEPPEEAAAAAPAEGELAEIALDGDTVHVIGVPDADAAVGDVVEDEATVTRAARLGAETVEVLAGDGFLSVRYR
jgi:hypothetical protein